MRFSNQSQNFGLYQLIPSGIKFLIILNVLVFVMEIALRGLTYQGISLDLLFQSYFSLMPFQGNHFGVWQLISYQFMHGGFFHIFWNMFSLWMFGADVEREIGTRRFLIFFLLSGIGAGVINSIISFATNSYNPIVGASGSIYGVMLAYAWFFPDRSIMMFPFFVPISARIMVGIFIAMSFINGVSNAGDGVAHFAHLGGAIAGFLLLKFHVITKIDNVISRFLPSSRSKKTTSIPSSFPYNNVKIYEMPTTKSQNAVKEQPSWFRSQESVSEYERELSSGEVQQKIDVLLDKISRSGYDSLSKDEKKFLNDMSNRI